MKGVKSGSWLLSFLSDEPYGGRAAACFVVFHHVAGGKKQTLGRGTITPVRASDGRVL